MNSLFEILNKEFDLKVKSQDEFDLLQLSHYFNEKEDRYKHIKGVAAQMRALVLQLDVNQDDKDKLMKIAYLHDIGYSKRVKNRGHHALDGAIFALEKGFSEDVALAIMFHTSAFGEIKYINKYITDIYNRAKKIFDKNEKAKYFTELITYCDLQTLPDGTPTSTSRRIFKILAKHDKNTPVYKNIKAHKRYFKHLTKKVRTSVIKQEN